MTAPLFPRLGLAIAAALALAGCDRPLAGAHLQLLMDCPHTPYRLYQAADGQRFLLATIGQEVMPVAAAAKAQDVCR